MGISMILVAHRYSCAPFFTNLLRVAPGGRFTIEPIDNSNDSSVTSANAQQPSSKLLLTSNFDGEESKLKMNGNHHTTD
jgi:hypothetical protein